ncbi:MAG: GNAT family N-acetyltransferase [Acidobacteria bacterium]|nr:GNAT family N-acetyltransferase [Acidobacteriota bacterium]
MPSDAVRSATEADNPALIDLERLCPQGARLRMYSEREDYFFRSRLYGDTHVLVAEDREMGRIFGVLAAAMKDLYIGGVVRPAAFFFDLRVHPDYRRSILGRHMLVAWKAMERWAQERGAHLIYGLMKHDNTPMTALVDGRLGYRFAGGMTVQSRPVFRRASVRSAPEVIFPENPRLVKSTLSEYGSRDFYPAVFRDSLLSSEMRASGLFSFHQLSSGASWASVGIFRAFRVMRTRVTAIPLAYRILQPVFSAFEPLLPLPRIPREGGSIGYCHVFNHLAEGPEGTRLWRALIAHANNLARDEGATLLTSAFDPDDRFHALFRRGAMNHIEYRLGMKALRPGVPAELARFYPDVRDMS